MRITLQTRKISISDVRTGVKLGAVVSAESNDYTLTSDLPINYLHWLAPDDTRILIEGGRVDYFIFHADGHAERMTLGTDVCSRAEARGRRAGRLLEGSPPPSWRPLRTGGHYAVARIHSRSR